ncbi:hypothetical protein DBV15_03301 [Temnothorax longispinosus]|uniref:RRM domain-containing protein n=1 Tax=Temnothorax longispinosus TaxID=300112 RepID=A0A4S2JS37_9HYME|nr:hypothetical protein DBV15_03301 [Temnothorax longispinosus]
MGAASPRPRAHAPRENRDRHASTRCHGNAAGCWCVHSCADCGLRGSAGGPAFPATRLHAILFVDCRESTEETERVATHFVFCPTQIHGRGTLAMSDIERSGSRSASPRRPRTADGGLRDSRSHSRSRKSRERKEHKEVNKYSRSRSRSASRGRKSYRGSKYTVGHRSSRSRSRSPYRGSRYSRSRSRSYSRSRYSRDRHVYRSHSRSPMSSRRRHIGNRDNPCPSRCLGVFGLSIFTTEQQIQHIFSRYGPVERVQVVIDAKTGRSRGFCFVYFESSEDAKVAKDQCTGMEIDGRRIRVDFSITQRAHTPTPGIYMGKPTHLHDRNWDAPRQLATEEVIVAHPAHTTAVDVHVTTALDRAPIRRSVGKDFGTLMNAPLSKGGHFVFKSEKAWTVDSSEYSEFFTLNLKEVSAAIDCVPFNEYVDVPDSDQLTSIYNDAERSKAAYSAILDELIKENAKTDQSKDMKSTTNVKPENKLDHLEKDPDSLGDIEEDLDFLLSLKEPLPSTVTEIAQPMSLSTSRSSDSKPKSKNIPNKPIDLDLEKWLDSVLDD